ncbi:bifunctional metallophosphatase/5'-nucleotidase [Nesterenkonia alkaliphila]|uniref:LPXTG cell wall anchor domain-containing protein n=1 Tax=Nesterenkonia alkaliphila TaxID=1463631 RepID=A0A7K1UH20_9MICC|nr:bifunctional UDP-sugar hydrolase/5'-nucleotidase [Nesterenkonia alkaliphila]MVT25758.1 LPXTG cell wall anchor domain-containing protein [Nesterenkonia alkaliphila]GFZ93046.1 hypothetical protein GCM10011359_23040 [Nesterenkonia alkaliphila]
MALTTYLPAQDPRRASRLAKAITAGGLALALLGVSPAAQAETEENGEITEQEVGENSGAENDGTGNDSPENDDAGSSGIGEDTPEGGEEDPGQDAGDIDEQDDDPEAEDEVVELQILNINDFHGRLQESASTVACTVDAYREQNPNTLFTGSGDHIGASTFTSFIQQDEPTIEALNAMGLDVTSIGNHEFDQGAEDFDSRVMPLSDFTWLGANARHVDTGEHLYEPYEIHEVGGVEVGFIGLNTLDMPRLVSPDGIAHIEWTSLTEEANFYAEHLAEVEGADVVVLLVHEGYGGAGFAELIENAHPAIDAVFSGHTHQTYAVQQGDMWVTQGGEYGEYLSHLELAFDTAAGEIVSSEARLIDLNLEGTTDGLVCGSHPEVDAIVAEAVEVADQLGSEVVATVEGEIPFARAQSGPGEPDNRAAASTLGELVADAQLSAVRRTNPEADFAITNSGGLRDDLPLGELSIRDLGNAQPFANTLMVGTFTGEQVYTIFEQQWREDQGRFSRHGQSSNVFYTYDPEAGFGERITGLWIEGEPVDPAGTYQVVLNSHMAGGGGGLSIAPEAAQMQDTGQNDLEAIVDYAREQAVLQPELDRGGIGVHWVTGEHEVYAPGDELAIDVSSLAWSHEDIPVGETLQVQLGETVLAEFDIDATWFEDSDERGRAEVRLEVPEESGGQLPLVLTEPVTGTELALSVQVEENEAQSPSPGGDEEETSVSVSVSSEEVVAGEAVTVIASGFEAEEDVVVELNPVLGEFTTDASGELSAEVTIPEDTEAGEYLLTVTGESGQGAAELTVLAPVPAADLATEDEGTEDDSRLASTGATITAVVLAALLLLIAGGFMFYRSRRNAAA